MIISERLLFKGLRNEAPSSNQDQVFHLGHAVAVSMIGVSVAGAAIGVMILLG